MKWITAFASVVTVTLGMLVAFRHEMASYNRWVADVLDPETPLPLPPPTEAPTVIAQISVDGKNWQAALFECCGLERATQIILPPDTKKLRLLTTKPSSLHVEHAEVADSVMTRAVPPFSDLPKHLRKVCQQKVLAFLHGHLMPSEAGYDAKNCELDDRNSETVWVCYEKPCTPKAVAY